MVGTFIDICYIGLCSISSIHSTSVFSFILFSSVVLSSTLLWTVWGAFWRSIYPYISVWEAIFLFNGYIRNARNWVLHSRYSRLMAFRCPNNSTFLGNTWQLLFINPNPSDPYFWGTRGQVSTYTCTGIFVIYLCAYLGCFSYCNQVYQLVKNVLLQVTKPPADVLSFGKWSNTPNKRYPPTIATPRCHRYSKGQFTDV